MDPYECAGPIMGQVTISNNLNLSYVQVELLLGTTVQYSRTLSGSDIAADGSYSIPVEYIDS